MALLPQKRARVGSDTFKNKWELMFFFIAYGGPGRAKCLICDRVVSGKRQFTIERHYNTFHKADYENLVDDERKTKLQELKTAHDDCTNNEVEDSEVATIHASYKVALNIAKHGKPFSDGEFIKQNLLDVAELTSPSSVPSFQKICLSRQTIVRRVSNLADDMYLQLTVKAKNFIGFSIALDESTDISDTAQLVLYVRGVDQELNITEDFLDMVSMKGTTTGQDLLQAVEEVIEGMGLNWDNLVSVTTDGAAAMRGCRKGFVSLLKDKLGRPDLPTIHCMVHQEALCAKVVKFADVMGTVVRTVNYIRSHGLNHRQLKEFLSSVNEEYFDIPYHCEVRWLSRGIVLKRFFQLRNAISEFLIMKERPEPKLQDSKWVADLAFLVGLTSHLNELNLKLQGENHLITDLSDKITAFEKKLALWEDQLSKENTAHFSELASLRDGACFEDYVAAIKSLRGEFNKRFQEIIQLRPSFNVFVTPFTTSPQDVPENLQLEILDLQSNARQKDLFYEARNLTEFYRKLPRLDFPRLHRQAAKLMSMFGSTYVCERFFSAMKIQKSRLRSSMVDVNLKNVLRLSVSRTIVPNIGNIVQQKHVTG